MSGDIVGSQIRKLALNNRYIVMANLTPILLITFNRPNHTEKVLERILESEPAELYVFQDGPRAEIKSDFSKCSEVRNVIEKMVAKHVDTKLHLRYSEVNLGCGAGPMTAIDWFFSNVDQGIVMEDDCLAHPDFFGYCEQLLLKYKHNKRVGFINSTLYNNKWQCKTSYGFSHYMVTGAWAAWKETWEGFDLDLNSFSAKKFFFRVLSLTGSLPEALWWFKEVRSIQHDKSKKSYWDYQMQILLFNRRLLTIHPAVNLISNIGFDNEGTHTLENDGNGNLPQFPILPLTHPKYIRVNKRKDYRCWSKAKAENYSVNFIKLTFELLKKYLNKH